MNRQRLAPERTVYYDGVLYTHRQLWALVRKLQDHGINLSIMCLACDKNGYRLYRAKLTEFEPKYHSWLTPGEGSPFLAVRKVLSQRSALTIEEVTS